MENLANSLFADIDYANSYNLETWDELYKYYKRHNKHKS